MVHRVRETADEPFEQGARAEVVAGEGAAGSLHPFCGGMPIDTAWKYLSNYVEKVLGKLNAA